ncbi:hypothetical protein [Helicobacter pylori]|uniref:hypothetical protein n=1 Tax=Helicobacter pylori TaxID=210 RepID=UPI000B340A8B|nr:hypothetical protein [Helicobacter pylori]
METNLWIKGLGVLSLALTMPLLGGTSIDVRTQTESDFNKYTFNIKEQTYLEISSNVDNIVIQNIELNRGNCKSKVISNTSLKSYESKRNEIMQQIKNARSNSVVEDKSGSSMVLEQIQEAKTQIEAIKVGQKKIQEKFSAINTYDELINKKDQDDSIFHNEDFQSIVPCLDKCYIYLLMRRQKAKSSTL